MHEDELVEAWRELARGARGRRDTEAEDHLQDAVVAALDEHRRTGRTPDTARAWLRTVARRREADRIRRAECERRAVRSGALAEPETYDVASDVLDRHEARWLATHVDQLPPTTRRVVRALADGGTQAEVARRLDLTPRAVEAHVRRARLALRRALDRAGAVVGLVSAHRWWRRGTPTVAVGVAAAVGLSMIGPGERHGLQPVPRPPAVIESAEPVVVRPVPRVVPTRAPRAVAVAAPATPPLPRADETHQHRDPAPEPADIEPDPPADEPPGPQVVLVWSNGSEAATPFRTRRDTVYEIRVAGTYSYNGRHGLADCGHYIPEHAAEWHPYETLVVDGTPSPCVSMPVNDLHAYQWRARGTGAPMRFRVQDAGGGTDNLGHLVVTVTPVLRPAPAAHAAEAGGLLARQG